MHSCLRMLPLFGRILFALIFLVSGLQKIWDFGGYRSYMQEYGLPMASLLLLSAILIELVGGALLVLGYRARWAAVGLFLYLIPTTLIFHTDLAQPEQSVNLLKNLAIMGGLLFVVAYGPGALSLDARRRTAEPIQ